MVLPAQSANALVIFNMASCTAKVIEIPSKYRGYHDICYDVRSYWLSPRYSGGTAVKWDHADGCNEIPVPDGWMEEDYGFLSYANGYVWNFLWFGSAVFKINVANNETSLNTL